MVQAALQLKNRIIEEVPLMQALDLQGCKPQGPSDTREKH